MAQVYAVLAALLAVGICRRLARTTMDDFVSVCTSLAIVSIGWDAIKPLKFPMSDTLFAVAFVAIVLRALRGDNRGRLPMFCWIGLTLVTLAILLNFVLPVSQVYAMRRFLQPGAVTPSEGFRMGLNLFTGAKLIMAMMVMPLAVGAAAPTRERLRTLFDLWGCSAVVSCLVAITDAIHVTSINFALMGPLSLSPHGRQGGLMNNPNHLATVATMTLPVVLTWMLREGRWRISGFLAALVLSYGIYLTGSRGGLVAGVATLAIGVVVFRSIRRRLIPIAVPAVCFIGGVLALKPGVVSTLLHHTRLNSSSGRGSDQLRSEVAAQAVRDIRHRPLFGVGFDIADQGHSIYLQALASGGLATLIGIAIYITAVVRATRIKLHGKYDVLVIASLVSLLTWVTMGAIENDFADRYPYVPEAMLLAAWMLREPISSGTTSVIASLRGRPVVEDPVQV